MDASRVDLPAIRVVGPSANVDERREGTRDLALARGGPMRTWRSWRVGVCPPPDDKRAKAACHGVAFRTEGWRWWEPDGFL